MKNIELRIGSVNDFSNAVKKELNSSSEGSSSKKIMYIQPKDVSKLLSAKRVKLMHEMRRGGNKMNVSDLAEKLNRKQEAISRDLKILNKFGLVQLPRSGRECHPIAEKITLTI